jgi:ABC-type transporter Mla subunit MlaD
MPDGRVGARASLKLDESLGAVPVDSRFAIRPLGAIGSKYVELTRGSSPHGYGDGAGVGVARTSVNVDLDQVLSTFDAPTRTGMRESLRGLGDAFAGRGSDVNETIARLPRFFSLLAPVSANLADRRTDLPGFITALDRTASTLAPVAGTQARLFTTMADTFDALSRRPDALRSSISEAAPTFATGERALRASQPFLTHTAELMSALDPTTGTLRASLPALNGALRPTAPALRQAVPVSERLRGTLSALGDLTGAQSTLVGLRALTATVASLNPQIRFYGPSVTVCQIPELWLEFVPDTLSAPTTVGYAERGIVNTTDGGNDDLATMGANEWVTGHGTRPGGVPQHLHGDTYPPVVDQHGNANCYPGQAGFRWGNNPYDDTPDHFYRRTMVEGFSQGNLGPDWGLWDANGRPLALGPSHTPPGETFTVAPGGRAPSGSGR